MKCVSCVLLTTIILILSNCSKDDPKLPALITSVFPATGQPGTSVSIHGSHFGQTPGDNVVTFNGVEAEVTQASDTLLVVSAPENASGGPIAVTVNKQLTNGPEFRYYHIYCYGSQNYYPAFWIDGVATVQAEQGHIYGLAVSGNDVYGVGLTYDPNAFFYPRMWKNDQVMEINNVPAVIRLNTVAVIGSDIYIGGAEYSPIPRKIKYWKNGQLAFTSDTTKDGTVRGMTADGSDLYLCGDEYPVAAYWKNGTYVPLSDGTFINEAVRIRIVGGDVHVVGTEQYGVYAASLKYWKNGVSMLPDHGIEGYSTGFALHGDDVYIAGYSFKYNGQLTNNAIARYWKNGKEVVLSDNTDSRYVSSIEVTDDAVIVLLNSFGTYRPYHSNLLFNGQDITPDYGPGVTGSIQGMFIGYY